MKKILSSFFAVLFITGCSPPVEEIDVAKEEEAIKKVLYEEGATFIALDMESLSALHVQDESDTRLSGSKVYSGWDEIEILFQSYFKRNKADSTFENARNEKENIILKVTGNNAWVICDNIWKWEAKGEPQTMQNIQISFLEKIDGDWKFSFNAFVAGPEEED